MSSVAQAMIAELEQEARTTRRVLGLVPGDRLEWRPHPKSFTLGQLALHVATLPRSFARVGQLETFDAGKVDFSNPERPAGADELLPTFEASVAEAKAFLAGLDEAAAAAPFRLVAGEREIVTMPKWMMLRSLMFNHSYHHRGELVVYLRLLEVPVPSIYGPSADENPFA